MDLYEEMQGLVARLQKSVELLRHHGKAFAEAEKEYKMAVNKKALELKAEENMPVTLINQVIYGYPEIANLRFKRDCAEVVYRANLEAINSYKLQIRIVEGQMQREWSVAKYDYEEIN